MTLKKMVDTHVHETFGNSKRLGEKDKEDIRKFLYKQLKNWGYHPLSSPGSDKSDLNNTTEKKNEATEDVQTVLQEVYIMITGNKCSTRSVSSEEDMESVVSEDNEATQVTLDMIKTMIDDLKKEMDDLKNINKTCFKMLGAEDETKKQMAIMNEKVKKLEKELNEISIKFASSQDKTETLKQKKLELKAKCKHLEQMQKEHFEKQNTLSDMKDFWKKLQSTSNLSRPRLEQTRIVNPLDSVDGPTTTDISLPSIRPPQKSSRSHRSHQGHLSTRSKMQDIPHENHHHLLPPGCTLSRVFHGNPWKI
ncbi:hypothetical protein DPMN_102600 [Dreissena polymorpha]|uniref:Uncharacterized protein n=2 Tax=Dreissena polymorpha TaxID=45954 RepID=A0A9D4LJB5_DREPO|nr:hypothetical protein DPMN_102600 [Dreissena polymorpha]